MSSDLKQYTSGMVREDKGGKIDYTLAIDGPMFERYAKHMTNGAKVHGKRNWMKACGEPELEDFKAGAVRHMIQWLRGDTDEDHAAAVIFNLNGAEYTRSKLCSALDSVAQGPSDHGSPSPHPLSEEAHDLELANLRKRLSDGDWRKP